MLAKTWTAGSTARLFAWIAKLELRVSLEMLLEPVAFAFGQEGEIKRADFLYRNQLALRFTRKHQLVHAACVAHLKITVLVEDLAVLNPFAIGIAGDRVRQFRDGGGLTGRQDAILRHGLISHAGENQDRQPCQTTHRSSPEVTQTSSIFRSPVHECVLQRAWPMDADVSYPRLRAIMRWVLAAFFTAAGIAHLLATAQLLAITPSWVPFAPEVIFMTGLFELAASVALVAGRWRKWAGVLLAI